MVIYISENNKVEVVEPREGWRGPQMSHSAPCYIQLSRQLADKKGDTECSGQMFVVVVVMENWQEGVEK